MLLALFASGKSGLVCNQGKAAPVIKKRVIV
jgi:hypothetical protein